LSLQEKIRFVTFSLERYNALAKKKIVAKNGANMDLFGNQ